MKIALISFEYPPDTALGGIATYAQQMVGMMAERGHTIEVFAGSFERSGTEIQSDRVKIHRVQVPQKIDFIRAVLPIFRDRHQAIAFDVLEGPEYGADAAAILQAFPDIPFVLKLHTPRFIIDEYEGTPNLIGKLRTQMGALRRKMHPFRNLECTHAREADEVAAPSWALGKLLIERWQLDPTRVHQFPLPLQPDPALLEIPLDTNSQYVTFIGRLDIKKGVVELAQAIPKILHQYPQTRFRLVGRDGKSPQAGVGMQDYLQKLLRPYLDAVEFTGLVPSTKIPHLLANTDICVFPSHWESFGLVCLEGMAAGRGVVGSRAGGMAEVIGSEQYGRLVPPQDKDAIAIAIIELLKDPNLRMQLGQNARQRVLATYSTQRIGKLQEESYIRAIQYRQQREPRPSRFLL